MSNQNFLLDRTSGTNINKISAPSKSSADVSVKENNSPSQNDTADNTKSSFKAKLDHAEKQYPSNQDASDVKDNSAPIPQKHSKDLAANDTSISADRLVESTDGVNVESIALVDSSQTIETVALPLQSSLSIKSEALSGNSLPLESETDIASVTTSLPSSVLDELQLEAGQKSPLINSNLDSTALASIVREQSAVKASVQSTVTPLATNPLVNTTASLAQPLDKAVVSNLTALVDADGDLPSQLIAPQVKQAAINSGSTIPPVAEATLLANSIATEIAPLQSMSKGNMTDKLFLNRLAELSVGEGKVESLVDKLTATLNDSATNLGGLTAANTSLAKPIALPQIALGVPFQQGQWSSAVAEKVMWMSSQGVKEAEIQMDPPELGPLTVKVSVSNEQAQVSFTVQHASVRESLDQSAVRLREMFAEEGLDLVDVDVSGQSQQEQEGESETAEENPRSYNNELVDSSDNIQQTPLDSSAPYNLVDAYI